MKLKTRLYKSQSHWPSARKQVGDYLEFGMPGKTELSRGRIVERRQFKNGNVHFRYIVVPREVRP